MGERAPSRRIEAADLACKLERDFYRDLSGVIQKWDRGLAILEEDERGRVVLVVQEIGLLRVIRDARIMVERYERSQRGGYNASRQSQPPKRSEQGVP